eukprot:Opistho-1_new@15936
MDDTMDAPFAPRGSMLERFPNDVLLTLITDHLVTATGARDVLAIAGTCTSLRRFVWDTRSVWVALAKRIGGADDKPYDPITIFNKKYSAHYAWGWKPQPPPPFPPCVVPSREEWDAMTHEQRWQWFVAAAKPRLCGTCGALPAEREVPKIYNHHPMSTNAVEPRVANTTPACAECIIDRTSISFGYEQRSKKNGDRYWQGIPMSLLGTFIPTLSRRKIHPNTTYQIVRSFRMRHILELGAEVYGSLAAYHKPPTTNQTEPWKSRDDAISLWEARTASETREYLASRRRDGETDAAVKARVFAELAADPSIRDRDAAIRPWDLHFTYGVPIPLCHAAALAIAKERRLRMDEEEGEGEGEEEEEPRPSEASSEPPPTKNAKRRKTGDASGHADSGKGAKAAAPHGDDDAGDVGEGADKKGRSTRARRAQGKRRA